MNLRASVVVAALAASACGNHGADAGSPDASVATDAAVVTGKGPPDFMVNGKLAIFTEITRGEVHLQIDVTAKTAAVTAQLDIVVHQPAGGSPVLDVVPAAAQRVSVDGAPAVALATVMSPDQASTMRMVDATVAAGAHTLAFETYALAPGKAANGTDAEGIQFPAGGFAFQTEQDDTALRAFTERYFPSGFEADRYPLTVVIDVVGTTAAQVPDVMTNGTVTRAGNTFTVVFPPHESTSCWFLHVLDRKKFKFATGMAGTVPITVYAKTQADADLALADAKVFLHELEADYGAFAHPSLLAAINTTPNDPEEYEGAVASDLDATETTPDDRGALGHELLHQWFGRSAHPYQGRDGWVDEAIAEWRDDGYPRATSVKLTGTFVPLAVGSPYQRQTPDAAYDQGSAMLQNLDFLFASRGGIKPVLAAFHARFTDKLYTSEDFLGFIREQAPDLVPQLDEIFAKMVYAGATPP